MPGTGQSSFVNPTNNLIDFSWTTDCSHLAVSNGCGSFSNTYTFALRMQDDFCPAPAISIATLRVTVLADPSQPPQLSCVNFDPSGAVDLSWVPPTDTGFSFGRYVIYYKPNSPANAVFTAVDTVSGWNTTNRLLTGLANNGDGLYMMRVLSHCGYISDPSDTLGLFILNVNAPPPPITTQLICFGVRLALAITITKYGQNRLRVPTTGLTLVQLPTQASWLALHSVMLW